MIALSTIEGRICDHCGLEIEHGSHCVVGARTARHLKCAPEEVSEVIKALLAEVPK